MLGWRINSVWGSRGGRSPAWVPQGLHRPGSRVLGTGRPHPSQLWVPNKTGRCASCLNVIRKRPTGLQSYQETSRGWDAAGTEPPAHAVTGKRPPSWPSCCFAAVLPGNTCGVQQAGCSSS